MLNNKKSQASMELLVLLAAALIVFLALLALTQQATRSLSGQTEAAQAQHALITLTTAATQVYQQGVGARTKVFITIPHTTSSVTIQNRSIKVDIVTGGAARETFQTTDFLLQGVLPQEEGNYWIFLEAKEGYVYISQNITSGSICSNNIKETGEACDGSDLAGQSCITQGFLGGTLTCTADCSAFNTSQCTPQNTIFNFNWQGTTYAVAGKNVQNWLVENTGSSSVTVASMTISWGGDNDSANLKKIKMLDDTEVWNSNGNTGSPTGEQSSPAVIDVEDFTLAAQTSYNGTGTNKLEFDKSMNNDAEQITITFTFSDASNYTTIAGP